MHPSWDELLTLMPESDIPDDARMAITALELRTMLKAVRAMAWFSDNWLRAQSSGQPDPQDG